MEFYTKVFRSTVGNLMTYADAPPAPARPLPEADRDLVLYAGVPVGDMVVMFMDMPSDSPAMIGNNINPTINISDKDEVVRIFSELKEDGEVLEELGRTFYSVYQELM